jgi:hypothetical protein
MAVEQGQFSEVWRTSYSGFFLTYIAVPDSAVGDGVLGLQALGVGLHAPAPCQHSFVGQVQFPAQLGTGLSLPETLEQQHHLRRRWLAAFKDCVTIQMIDALAVFTPIHR